MSPDQLTSEPGTWHARQLRHAGATDDIPALESAIVAVLHGVAPARAAVRASVPVATLLDAIDLYCAAGRAALARQAPQDWLQVNVQFPKGHDAECVVATRLSPRLRPAEASGLMTSWWYIRKTPHWRIRFRTGSSPKEALRRQVKDILDGLAAQRLVTTWSEGIYEPEVWAFGGPAAMGIAHHFFHTDSACVLAYLRRTGNARQRQPVLGRRELSMLLCTALLRGAGQDWHEQGDVWHRVSRMRPLPLEVPPERLGSVLTKVRRLLAFDVRPADAEDGPVSPLARASSWLDAAAKTGRALRELADSGKLHRGLRDVLAHHVIFHWNRFGLTDAAQCALAHAAVAATLGAPAEPYQRRVLDVART